MSLVKVVSSLVKNVSSCAHDKCFPRNSIKGEYTKVRILWNSWTDQKKNSILIRCYSEKPFISPIKESSEEAKKAQEKDKKKKSLIPRITLLDQADHITVTTLPEANKLAERRGLKLVFLRFDSKSNRNEYKMVSQSEYLKASLSNLDPKTKSEKRGSSVKKEKLLSITAQIEEGDLRSKIQKIIKWLEKRHEVRIAIANKGNESSERIMLKIENEIKTVGRVTQKSVTSDSLKCVLLPPKERKKKEKEETDEST